MRKYFAIITISLLLLCTELIAQPGQYQFLRIATANGLSHNRINCILKDSKGFMWLGTMSGLNRYDGYKFRIFRHDLRDSTSLIDDYISKIMEGPDGKLWVETRSFLNIFDPATETFIRNPQSFLRQLSLPDAPVSNILKDKKGNYWLVYPQKGLFKYVSATRQIMRVSHNLQIATGLAQNNIAAFGEDSKGDFWTIYQDGMIEKISGKDYTVIYRAQLSSMYGIAAEDFDKDGNMDILLGGNFYQSKPEAGIYDASYGILLKRDGKGGFTALPAQQSGINIRGAIRDMVVIRVGKKKVILVVKNNEAMTIFN